jgi:glycosyltransferase involved in cell wall biosynthesis
MARIAFLIPDLGGGGAERVAVTLIRGFVERGHEIDVLLLRNEGQFLDWLPATAKIVDLKASRVRNAIAPLFRYFRERRPDALQVSMWSLTIIGILVGRLALGRRMRIVTSDHASLSHQYANARLTLWAIRLSTRLFYPLADARICVSSGTADDLGRLSGLGRVAFEVVYNPIPGPDREVIVPQEIEKKWTGKEGRILTVGSLKAEKNHAFLVRAFTLLSRRRDVNLMLVGHGQRRNKIEELVRAEGVSDRVSFAGFDINVWPYYYSAHIFVLSSDHEGFGNVIVEAMHAGLPVVSTDCDFGPAEILSGGRYGRLVPCGDAEALAAALEEALTSHADQAQQKERANDFSTVRAVDHYLTLLLKGH